MHVPPPRQKEGGGGVGLILIHLLPLRLGCVRWRVIWFGSSNHFMNTNYGALNEEVSAGARIDSQPAGESEQLYSITKQAETRKFCCSTFPCSGTADVSEQIDFYTLISPL